MQGRREMSRKDGTGGHFLRAAERLVPAGSLDWSSRMIHACRASCGRPIGPGSGGYRTEEGDVHEECYEKRHAGGDGVGAPVWPS